MLNTLLHISQFGLASVILALSSAWIADTGAYFAGTFLGKHKLCPEISPKKTVEGFFGGIVTDVVVMVIFALIYSLIAHAHVHYLLADFYWHCLCCNQRTGRFECICTKASAGNQRLRKYHARTRRCHGSF